LRRQDRKVGRGRQLRDDWPEALRLRIRDAVRDVVEETIEAELEEALGAVRYGRSEERVGYRHGAKSRRLITSAGGIVLDVPRARVTEGGTTREWTSHVLPRYARRTRDVDQAVLGMYLGGVNTRKVKAVLRPLVGKQGLSKSTVSRVVARLTTRFETWSRRPLAKEKIVILVLDGFGVDVRIGNKVRRVPVLAVLGVKADGQKVLVALELAGEESTASWEGLLRALEARGLKAPLLCIVDGNPGLRRAVGNVWPRTKVQRCTVHKLRNLQAKAPKGLHDEIREDYRAFIYAESAAAARTGRANFLRKWSRKCPAVATSLEEAGDELLTFLAFPREQWKCLRTTNSVERLNEEFRRRIKTQASLPSEQAVVVLLFALLDEGLVRLRKIDGWDKISEVLLARTVRAA
jgi:transposase-like protein